MGNDEGGNILKRTDQGATWTRIYTITTSSTGEQSVPITAKMGGCYLYELLEGRFCKYNPTTNTWTPIRNVGTWGAITIDPKNLNLNIDPANCDPEWICNTNVGDWHFDPFQNDLIWFAEGMGIWQLTGLAGSTLTLHFISRGIEEMGTADIVVLPGGAPVVTVIDRQGFYKSDPTRTLVDDTFAIGCSLDYAVYQPNNLAFKLS